MPRRHLTVLLLTAPALVMALMSPAGAAHADPAPAGPTATVTTVTFVDARHLDATTTYNCAAGAADELIVTIDQTAPVPPPSTYEAGGVNRTKNITCDGTDRTVTLSVKNDGDLDFATPGGGFGLARLFNTDSAGTVTNVSILETKNTW
ncbi:hypothetical protein [Kitasatospora sp. McL0602]|uniref:hypothetical protein n=1 Tax=Kitasatospora sp. McL0602 TaxID=3439530 RepID=UPI003F8967A8